MSDKPTVLVLAEEFYPSVSGGAYAKWEFCSYAAEIGYDIVVFTTRDEDAPSQETVDGVDIRRPVSLPEFPVYSSIALLMRIVASIWLIGSALQWGIRNKPDVVLSSEHLMHWAGHMLSTLLDIPLVSFIGYTPSVRSDPPMTYKFLLERVNFHLFLGDVVFCRTDTVANIVEQCGNSDVRTLYGILDEDLIQSLVDEESRQALQKRFGFGSNRTTVAFVGRLVPIKRPSTAVDIVANLSEKYNLVFVGDGPVRSDVAAKVKEYEMQESVEFFGERSHREALRIILAADILLVTSVAESYCATAIEGAVLGTPVFSTPVGVLPNVSSDLLQTSDLTGFASRIKNSSLNRNSFDEELLKRHSGERLARELTAGIDDVLQGGK